MGDIDRLEVKIAQIAGRQQGNVTREQLIGLGMSATSITRWVRLGRLHRVFRGVYAVGRPPTTPIERATAAVLACGERSALSHGSALSLYGLWQRWEEPFEVTVAGDRRPQGITVHRAAGLLRRDVRVEQSTRVTSPARTLLDMAPRMPAKSLTRRVNEARRAELLRRAELADVIDRFPYHPGAPLLRPHAETNQNATRSGFEDEFLAFCERYGLPTPRTNINLHGFEVDAYFEEAKLIVECDGWPFHNDRQAFEDDRERDATMLLHGIATVRFTKRRLRRDPDREAARLTKIIAGRRPYGAVASRPNLSRSRR
ncbi:MAG TPA: type IV toxin-antitoxin system AbiEi family antitoxin domain-containing protein [Solirubrobacteraceae bacterium]|nr:type IV toxin-antitoxin system AbiEi family antitoxin domain-containing protein [Solirubrobacteraceae bacterium]